MYQTRIYIYISKDFITSGIFSTCAHFSRTQHDRQQQNKLTLIIAFDEMRNSVARSATNFVLLAKSSPFSNSLSTVCSARPFFDIKSLHVRRFSNFNDNSEMAAFNSWLGTDNTFLSSSSSSISIARLCDKISKEKEEKSNKTFY